MKSIFNKTWKGSNQPRKQVKYRSNAPNHILRSFMTSLLDKPLRTKKGFRNIEVRKGDEVKVMRGSFKGKIGKISVVDVPRTRVQIEGLQRSKAAGEKLETWFNPSNIKIISLDETDKKRFKNKKVEKKQEEKKVPSSTTQTKKQVKKK